MTIYEETGNVIKVVELAYERPEYSFGKQASHNEKRYHHVDLVANPTRK